MDLLNNSHVYWMKERLLVVSDNLNSYVTTYNKILAINFNCIHASVH